CQVMYETLVDGKLVKRRSMLSELLARVEVSLGVNVANVELRGADNRKLLIDALKAMLGQVDLRGRMDGSFKAPTSVDEAAIEAAIKERARELAQKYEGFKTAGEIEADLRSDWRRGLRVA